MAAKRAKKDPYLQAHQERLRLIHKPFEIRRIGTGSAMPWAGTITGDSMPGGNPMAPGRIAGMTNDDDGFVMQRYYDRTEQELNADDYDYELAPWSPQR